jgi:hypothetical protein
MSFVGTDLQWVVEKGEFDIQVDKLRTRFSISETKKFNGGKAGL